MLRTFLDNTRATVRKFRQRKTALAHQRSRKAMFEALEDRSLLATLNVGVPPYLTIQSAINAASPGDTVIVQAGTYYEDLDIQTAITLQGPNAGNDANGARVAEAIIRPATSQPDPFAPFSTIVVFIGVDDVTIDGFTIDGSNPAISGFEVNVNGVDVDAAEGIWAYVPGGNINISNNIVKNTSYAGIELNCDSPGNFAISDNTVQYNKVDNIGATIGGNVYGSGVLLAYNAYAQVTDNVVTNVRYGVQTNENFLPNPNIPFTPTISDNDITATRVGIWHSLQHANGPGQDASAFTISDNTIAAGNDATADYWNGIFISSLLDNVGSTISGNIISGSGANALTETRGYEVWDNPTTQDITISGGSVTGAKYGVLLDNQTDVINPPTVGLATDLTIDGVAISGAALAGVYVKDVTGNALTLDIKNSSSITGGGRGLYLDGAVASLVGGSPTLNNTAFSGQSGDYVTFANSAMDNKVVNGLTATFAGSTAGSQTVAQNYSIEDKMTHSVDNATLGFVRVDAGDVYVTSSSFTSLSTPTTTTPNIQRAVNESLTGDTVHVQAGSYTGNVDLTLGADKALNLSAGASAAQTTINGSLTLSANDTLSIEIDGTNPATDYDNFIVTGSVTLGGSTLALSGSHVPTLGSFKIIDGGTGLSGTFNGLPNASTITFNGQPLYLYYIPAPFYDVVLYTANPVINTGNGDDTIIVRKNGLNLEVEVNLALVLNQPLVTINSLTINGQQGNDRLFVDNAVGGTFVIPAGITYDGGPQTAHDSAQVKGNGAQSAVYTPSTSTPGTGVVVTTSGSTLNFLNIEPLDVTGMVTVTLVTPSATDVIDVAEDFDFSTGLIDALKISGTSNAVAFESLYVWNNGTVVINAATNDGGGGNDSVTFTSANNAHANGNITVTTGTGTNTLNVNGVTTVAGTFSATGLDIANVNADIDAATITGDSPLVNVDDAPSGEIQDGIDLAASGATVNVAAGNYIDDIVIDKVLSLLGPNSAIDPNFPGRVAEAIIRPETSDPDPSSLTYEDMILIGVSNVTVKGFTLDGNNTGIASGILVNGVDVDATELIASYDGVGNITASYNILKNSSYSGMTFYNFVTDAATTNNFIQYNKFDNIGHIPYGYGMGVFLCSNFYAQVTDNVMTNVRIGVQEENYFRANPGPAASISNNNITSTRIGVWYNLVQLSAPALTISGNTIAVANEVGASQWDGMFFSSMFDSVSATVTGNTISATPVSQLTVGYEAWNDPTSATVTVTGGTVTGANYGAWVNNYDGFLSDGLSTVLTLDGVSISGASLAGVYVSDNPLNSNGATAKAALTNLTTITGGTRGLLVDGADAGLAGNTLNNTAFTGQSGDYITLSTSAMDNLVITGTSATFAGTTGGAKTIPQNYAVEDKITHAIDNATLGFVRVDAGDVYVTPSSFTSLSAPITTTPDVQRGVDNAIAGDIVHVNTGTYPNPVSVNKNITVDGEVNGSGDPNSIIAPAAGTVMTVVSPATSVTLSDLALTSPGGGAALSATLATVGTTLNLTNLNSSGAGTGGNVNSVHTLNFTTNDNANTVYVTGVASSIASTSPLLGKAANKIEVAGKLLPLGYTTASVNTLNVDVKNGDDTVSASPATGTFINHVGGPHGAGDKLNLDMSGTTPVVIVDGAYGNADSASTKTLHFSQFETLCVFDPVLINVGLGDFYLRGTDNADYIEFRSAAQVNPVFRVRFNNTYYPVSGGNYGPYITGVSDIFVYGRGGNDTITMYNTRLNAAFFGEIGDDIITGGYGNDLLVGGVGNDRLNGGAVGALPGGGDEVWGDDYNPALDTVSVASQTLAGGNDQINTYGGNDCAFGQGGIDLIYTGLGNDYISGGAGNDQIDGQAGDDRIYGGDGNDVLKGAEGNDIVAGNDGNDSLYGRVGNDILIGGAGIDVVNGNEDSDVLVGNDSSYTGQNSKSLAKSDLADAALMALMALWGPSPVLADLAGFASAASDGSNDTLWGGGAADAFFGLNGDKAPDRNSVGYGPDLN